mgnify:CR=1 FL=1
MLKTLALAALFLAAASAVVPAQTLDEMAGQMVVVGFQGDGPDDAGVAAIRAQVAAGEIGGVIYLRTNVASLSAVRAINSALAEAASGPRPFVMLDQEGGQVQRLTPAVGFNGTPSARDVARRGLESAAALYADLAARLAAQGFNVNFGPVVDLNLNPDNPVIARFGRSYGRDPERVTAFASAFIAGHHAAGMGTALKHFPGHGSSLADSHEGFVDVTNVWSPDELEPYRALIGEGLADMVMVAHIYHADYAGGEAQLPASLSPDWIGGVLRGDLGYRGVVISDDMEMAAIRSRFSLRETVVRAVLAGNDILLFSNTAAYHPELGSEIHAILVEAAEADPAFAARIEESYERILALKERLGLAG